MSGLIGALRISLGLDSAAFETGAKRAGAQVDAFGSRAEKAGFKVGSMAKSIAVGAAALAGGAIAGQIMSVVKSGLEYASSLGEQAQQLGVTTRTLQEYRYAASQTGISNEEMEKALAKLNVTLGKAASGSKAQADAFDKLGISVRNANGQIKDVGDLMPEIAEALSSIQSPAEKSARLVELFGKSGQSLLPLLSDGAKGVNSLRGAANELGIVISDEYIKRADDAADKMSALNQMLQVKISAVVAENADKILAMANAIESLIGKIVRFIQWGQKLADSPAGRLLGMANSVAGKLNPVGNALEAIGAGFDKITGKGGPAGPAAAPVAAKPKSTTPFPALGGGMPRTGGTFKAGSGPLANLAGGGLIQGSSAGVFAGLAAGNRVPIDKLIEQQANDVAKVLGQLDEPLDRLAAKAEETTGLVVSSFGEMATDAVDALGRLADSVQRGGFLGILSGVLGFATQLGGSGLLGAKIQANVRASRSIPGFASGTNFAPGGLSLVGERGPELVDLPRGAKVYPNGTGPGGGGGNVYHMSGNLLTPEFWQQIQAMDGMAAQVGGEIGFRKVSYAGSRRLA